MLITSIGAAVLTAAEESSGGDQSILLPASYDIIWGGLSFLIVFVLFWKYVLPRMQASLAERTERIEGGMAKAEALQVEARAQLEQYQTRLASARDEAAGIREKAQAEKAAILEEARREAAEAAAQIQATAMAQIAAEKAKAISDVRREAGTVAADLAEKIIGESLDPAKSRSVVDRFIAELEASTAGR
jgi:F-type H+-transporting ATPase subunit b